MMWNVLRDWLCCCLPYSLIVLLRVIIFNVASVLLEIQESPFDEQNGFLVVLI
jgi:hypothetical protein